MFLDGHLGGSNIFVYILYMQTQAIPPPNTDDMDKRKETVEKSGTFWVFVDHHSSLRDVQAAFTVMGAWQQKTPC